MKRKKKEEKPDKIIKSVFHVYVVGLRKTTVSTKRLKAFEKPKNSIFFFIHFGTVTRRLCSVHVYRFLKLFTRYSNEERILTLNNYSTNTYAASETE